MKKDGDFIPDDPDIPDESNNRDNHEGDSNQEGNQGEILGRINQLVPEIIDFSKQYLDIIGYDDTTFLSDTKREPLKLDQKFLGREDLRGKNRVSDIRKEWIIRFLIRLSLAQQEAIQSENASLPDYLNKLLEMKEEITTRLSSLPRKEDYDKIRGEVNRILLSSPESIRDNYQTAENNISKIQTWLGEYQRIMLGVVERLNDSETDQYRNLLDKASFIGGIDVEEIEKMDKEEVQDLVIFQTMVLTKLIEAINRYYPRQR